MVTILALDHAPWRGSVEILRDADAELNVVVVAGATVQGILLGADGKSAGGIQVKTPVADPLGLRQSRSAADGSFTLTGLPAGQVMLQAYHFKRGKVEATVNRIELRCRGHNQYAALQDCSRGADPVKGCRRIAARFTSSLSQDRP